MKYEYKCNRCGASVEREYSITDESRPDGFQCDCGGVMQRLFSVPLVIYHGGGFYTNNANRETIQQHMKDADKARTGG